MKGVLCCGGKGSRLGVTTQFITNKHLLLIYDEPMVFRALLTLVNAGVDEVCIVVGGQFAGSFIQLLGNGEDFGLKRLQYVFQRGEEGIAAAVALTEDFADGEDVLVLLCDNMFDEDFSQEVKDFKGGAKVFLKQVSDPERFGVPVFSEIDEDILMIEEKPKSPQSAFAVTGIYLYDGTLYDKIRTLKPSNRGELEITDVNNAYIREGRLDYSIVGGFWTDAGTHESLFKANEYWANKAMKED